MISRIAVLALVAALISIPAFAQKADKQINPTVPAETESLLPEDRKLSTFYKFLFAEIASQRDQGELAAEAYAEVARETRDPRVAQRAVEAALTSRDMALALKAANLWLDLEPNS